MLYTCADDFPARLPSMLALAGIASKKVSPPDFGEGCEQSFALELTRGKGTVELSGFYLTQENRFVIGIGCGRNPLRWYWDIQLSSVVRELLMNEGMTSLSPQTSTNAPTGTNPAQSRSGFSLTPRPTTNPAREPPEEHFTIMRPRWGHDAGRQRHRSNRIKSVRPAARSFCK